MVLYILKADTLHPHVIAAQGDYGEIYSARLRTAGFTDPIEILNVEEGEYPAKVNPDDSIMISGSKKDAWSELDWILKLRDYIKELIGKVPVFGVCFGHQIIARALGAKMGPSDKGWEASALPVAPSQLAKDLFPTLEPSPIFMHMHKDQVFEVPENTELLFSTDITPVQGYYRKNEIFSVQFHPEFDQQIVGIIVNFRFEGEFREDAIKRAAAVQSGPELFKYATKFLKKELQEACIP